MSSKQLQLLEDIITLLKQPKSIFIMAAVAGLIPIMLSFVLVYLPKAQAAKQSGTEFQALLEEQATLRQSPIPEPFRQETASEWLKKIPIKENHSELLRELLLLETESGSRIESFKIGEESEEPDLLEQLDEVMEQAEAAKKQEKPQATRSENDQSPAGSPLKLELVQLNVTGSYHQIMHFWNNITALDRIISIKDWSLSVYSGIGGSQAESAAGDEQGQQVLLIIRFHMYTAPFFAVLDGTGNVSGSVPALSDRRDPTLSDRHFFIQDH